MEKVLDFNPLSISKWFEAMCFPELLHAFLQLSPLNFLIISCELMLNPLFNFLLLLHCQILPFGFGMKPGFDSRVELGIDAGRASDLVGADLVQADGGSTGEEGEGGEEFHGSVVWSVLKFNSYLGQINQV